MKKGEDYEEVYMLYIQPQKLLLNICCRLDVVGFPTRDMSVTGASRMLILNCRHIQLSNAAPAMVDADDDYNDRSVYMQDIQQVSWKSSQSGNDALNRLMNEAARSLKDGQ